MDLNNPTYVYLMLRGVQIGIVCWTGVLMLYRGRLILPHCYEAAGIILATMLAMSLYDFISAFEYLNLGPRHTISLEFGDWARGLSDLLIPAILLRMLSRNSSKGLTRTRSRGQS